jgi:predicted CoA-substrate-specific enzyme activase
MGIKMVSFFAGIDVGSSFTKAVIIDQNKNILGSYSGYSGLNLRSTAEKALQEALPNTINLSEIRGLVATGYGRKNVKISNIPISDITEISCSAKAAHFLYPNKDVTVVDIGGQDTKIIKIRGGKREGFKMNRKCAAGTGTFLEELALKLRIQMSDLNDLALQSSSPAKISSYCTVFAGTEILSRIREGAIVEDMIRGAFHSVVKRVMEIDTLENEVVLTGGVVAYNPVILDIFEAELGKSISVPASPQLFVALGSSLYALEDYFSS